MLMNSLLLKDILLRSERVGYFVQELPEDFIKKNQEKNEVTKEEPEHEYFADFMANRISLKFISNLHMESDVKTGSL